MSTKSIKSITLETSVKGLKVYPIIDTTKTMKNLKTVGFKLSKEQAIDLARVLLAANKEWDKINVKAVRSSNRITVTTL